MGKHFVFNEYSALVNELDDNPGSKPTPLSALIKKIVEVKNPIERSGPPLYKITDAARMIGISAQTIRNCIADKLIPELPQKDTPRKIHGKEVAVAAGVPLSSINILRDHYNTSLKAKMDSNGAIVIAVTNQKGGVAKSATTNMLAQGLVKLGARVLVIDHDNQGTQTNNFGYMTQDFSQFAEGEYFQGRNKIGVSHAESLASFYDQAELDLQYAVTKTSWPGLDIIRSNVNMFSSELNFHSAYKMALYQAESTEAKDKITEHYLHYLKRGLEPLKENYDVILIDSPPSLSIFTINIITACDGIINPMPPRIHDIASTIQYQQTICSILEQFRNREILFCKNLVTLYQSNKKRTHVKIVEEFREAYTDRYFFKTVIKNLADIEESYADFLSPYEFDGVSKDTIKMIDQFCNEVYQLILDVRGK